jgi:hypothetical protein
MPRIPVLLGVGLGLSACAENSGYIYTYDPYLGPRGHYVTLADGPPPACARFTYVGPYNEGQFRGGYYSGPYCAPPEEPAHASPP